MNFSLAPTTPEHWTIFAWFLASLCAFCIGWSKTGFGGVGTFYVLVMALLMPARASTGFILPMLLFADVFAVRAFARHADWTHLKRLLPSAFLGIVVAYFAMKHLGDAAYKPVIGWIVLVLCAIQWLRARRESWFQSWPHSAIFSNATGLGCGVTSMLANASGPVATLYFLVGGLPKMEFVGTGAWFFFLMNLFKAPFSYHMGLINLSSLKWNFALFPLVLLGVLSGKWLLERVPQKLFETLLLWFSVIAAAKLIFS